MKRRGTSLTVFGSYVLLVAATLLLVPNLMLGVFGLPETDEVWVRVVGIPLVLLGVYYFLAGRHRLEPFIRWSIPARASVVLLYAGLVVFGLAQPILLMIGLVDAIGALWTWLALRSDVASSQPPTA